MEGQRESAFGLPGPEGKLRGEGEREKEDELEADLVSHVFGERICEDSP